MENLHCVCIGGFVLIFHTIHSEAFAVYNMFFEALSLYLASCIGWQFKTLSKEHTVNVHCFSPFLAGKNEVHVLPLCLGLHSTKEQNHSVLLP